MPPRPTLHRFAQHRAARAAALGVVATAATILAQPTVTASAAALTGVDLSTYVRVGRYDLPEPSRSNEPAGSLLAQEASSVTYNWDTDTLFVTGDGGTSIVQVSKTGQLIDSMSLPAGSSPAGTEFYDTEGLTYVGGGRFVVTEERYRQANLFTYVPNTTLTRAAAKTVKLGTTVGNVGIEGITYDAQTGGYIAVKEKDPQGIFATQIDFDAGTATNGSPTTVDPVNLFTPSLAGLSDLSDVYALANVSTLSGPDASRLLVLSQESGKVINVGRDGSVSSTLTLVADADNPLSIQDQTTEGVTLDRDGNLYVVNEQGGGDSAHPQLWVFAPSSTPNAAPTGVTLTHQVTSIADNTSTATRFKVADVSVADDGLGTNALSVTGPDAAAFEVDATGLYLKAGTVLDRAVKSSYSVSVAADDTSVGATPDATSAPLTLAVTAAAGRPSVVVTEVSPWSSGESTYQNDWFELTNTGTTTVSLAGWKIDDSSATLGNAVALNGVSSLAPGESAVFLEGDSDDAVGFNASWFGSSPPAGFKIGYYAGSGVGLSTGGDAVAIFDAAGDIVTGVSFGSSTTGFTFDNAAGAGGVTSPFPPIPTLSVAGTNGAFVAGGATGSPGRIAAPVVLPSVRVTEVAPWGSGNTTYKADWFELTNTGTTPVDLSGWKIDDNSNAAANAVALTGVTTLAPGQSAIFLEGSATEVAAFKAAWFGDTPPSGLAVGSYSGSGVGLSTGGDAVNVFDAAGNRVTGIAFGSATTGVSFDNAEGQGSSTLPLPVVTTLSSLSAHGAFVAGGETGSPATIAPDTTPPTVTYSGNAGTYEIGSSVAITCKAADGPRGSGVASTTCADVSGTAASFGVGPHTVTATATDNAGNVGTGSVTFTVVAAPVPAQLTAAKSVNPITLLTGYPVKLTGLKAKSKITLTVRRGNATLKTVTATASTAGAATLDVRLNLLQVLLLPRATLELRAAVTATNGTATTLTQDVKVTSLLSGLF